MSAIQLLQREDIDALLRELTPTPQMDPSEIQREAAELLNYHPDIPKKPETPEEQLRLVRTLQELGIRPYTNESVTAYKKRKQAEMANPPLRRRLLWAVNGCALAAIATLVAIGFRLVTDSPSGLYFFLFVVFCFATFILSFLRNVVAPGKNLDWKSTPLTSYTEPIPENILALAIQIRKKLGYRPGFYVSALSEREATYDPFLFIRTSDGKPGKRDYFIAVWDEPTFKPTHEDLNQPPL